MLRGNHSGENFSLKSWSDLIWKKGLSLLHEASRPPSASASSGCRARGAGPRRRSSSTAGRSPARPGPARVFDDQELGHAVGRVGIVAHEIERVTVVVAVRGHEPQEPAGAPVAVDRDADAGTRGCRPSRPGSSAMVKPRSGFLPRHCSLMALSCRTSSGGAVGLHDQLELVVLGRPGPPPGAHPSSPARRG